LRGAALGSVLLLASVTVSAGDYAMATAERLVAAFNQHDPNAMAALLNPSFQLFNSNAEGDAELAASGPQDLKAQMVSYFASHPTVRSIIEERMDGPRFASFRERAISVHDGEQRSASSIAVYEVVDGKILRVWYYPAEAPVTESVQ
jgi:hypothetical protein